MVTILLHTPAVQSSIGRQASQTLSQQLGTDVSIGSINPSFFNRIVVDDIYVADQQGRQMLRAGRIAAKIDMLSLIKGKIVISSAQLFGMKADLYQASADAKPNFQFIIDSLSSKEEKERTPLNLQIKSLIIRNGSVRWDRLDKPHAGKTFDPSHISTKDITAHIAIDCLTEDSLSVNIRRLSLKEQSGLDLRKLSLKATATTHKATISNLHIELPATAIVGEQFTIAFRKGKSGQRPDFKQFQYDGILQAPYVRPADFAWLLPHVGNTKEAFSLSTAFAGTQSSLLLDYLKLNTKSGNILLNLMGSVHQQADAPRWHAQIHQLHVNESGANSLFSALGKEPSPDTRALLNRLHHVDFAGEVSGRSDHAAAKGTVKTGIGNARFSAEKRFNQLSFNASTENFMLGRLLADDTFGIISADVSLKTAVNQLQNNAVVKATIPHLDYRGYTYRNISLDGKTLLNARYTPVSFEGKASINDPNGNLSVEGHADLRNAMPKLIAKIQAANVNPAAMGLTSKWAGSQFDFTADADITGTNANNAVGNLSIRNFRQTSHGSKYEFDQLTISQQPSAVSGHRLSATGDFGELHAEGNYDYETIAHSIANIVRSKLPTLPGLPARQGKPTNHATIEANIIKGDWLPQLLGIPIALEAPIRISGQIDDAANLFNLTADAPAFSYDGSPYQDGRLHISTDADTLRTAVEVKKIMGNGQQFAWMLKANAADNTLFADISFDNHAANPLKGTISANADFYKSAGHSTASIHIKPSDIVVGDTIWKILPGNVLYDGQKLVADHVVIRHDQQFLDISGTATKDNADTLTVNLQDIDVSYILDMVNFHSVTFQGLATGKAQVSGAFGKPDASALLTVKDFHFQEGPMGTLHAYARLNNEARQIDISATADEGLYAKTIINGYISPQNNYIDLGIDARNTNLAFVESFCKSFMRDIDVRGNGHVRVFGPLKTIYMPHMGGTRPEAVNLSGMVVADGTVGMKPLGTVYTLRHDTIRLVPDEISFVNDSIFDRDGHHAIVNGKLRHTNLKHLTYDLNVEADNLLAYDYRQFGDNTFCGTVYGTGTCSLSGGNGETNIEIEVRPEAGTVFRYNASSPDGLRDNEFITWRENAPAARQATDGRDVRQPAPTAASSPLHINFIIHANPNATLDVLMDEDNGDNIALHGDGTLRATWFNKGSFDMFGNYVVTDGTYKLSIQNVIKKEFLFQSGGTIAFGGDPYNAVLDLKAVYTINGVPLSDLNIGRSFTSNNIRVNCLMNISGTPQQPHVDFDLDMPTISADARQMVFSLINSEEEMNQQVIYLLAVGRFLSQGANNAGEDASQQSQTSLAMQSLLSGTISQQLNNLLSNTLNTSNWNFGANISTGDEGFNNAQYEGILSGRMLNNRLLINGEFGYRDNANVNTSFIGDFDIRYLLRPSGSLAVKVYNQTNDRYFTRNSLNTQGVGLILKKDFGNWKELFMKKNKPDNQRDRRNKKKKTAKGKEKQKTPANRED